MARGHRPGRALRALTASVLIAGTGAVWQSAAGGAETERAFVGTAEASGLAVQYGIPGFVVVERFVDAGGPVSQSVLSSDGSSSSFASLPYPGGTFVGYPGVASLLVGMTPPGYPFYVSSSHPTQPQQALGDPAGLLSLKTDAADQKTSAEARVSPPNDSAPAPVTGSSSSVTVEENGLTAKATSIAQALAVGPLSIGLVRSESVTTYRPGEANPTTTTQLIVQGGRVGDMTFDIGRDGLKVADAALPVPSGDGLTALNSALKSAGLAIHLGEATKLQGGASAQTFEIVQMGDVPGAGGGVFRLRLGGATSFVSLGAGLENPQLDGGATSIGAEPEAAAGTPSGYPMPATGAGAGSVGGAGETLTPGHLGTPTSGDMVSSVARAPTVGPTGTPDPAPGPVDTGVVASGRLPAASELAAGSRELTAPPASGAAGAVAGVVGAAGLAVLVVAGLGRRKARPWTG